ncbi:MAG: hypothetical protein IJY04_09830 [Clostridia bacterium]|nr:hypothetical protein [Clostridia bacterium]
MGNKEKWDRPYTNKLYLHPPLAERIALLCPDLKILDLALKDDGTHVGQEGIGILFLHGKELEGFERDGTSFREVVGGLPIYEAHARAECDVSVEAFCNFERNPTVFFKVTLSNSSENEICDRIAIMPRSGRETYMLNQHQEGYNPYRPNYKNWFMLKRTWRELDGGVAADDRGLLRLKSDDIEIRWMTDSENGHRFAAADCFCVNYRVKPGESAIVYGALRASTDRDPIADFDYEAERIKAEEGWLRINDGIRIAPDTDDEAYLVPFRHLAIQLTQMLARYEGSELVSVRQGDIGRFVWPYEGAQVVVCLDRLGFSSYTADACRGFCKRWFTKEGEDRGKIKSNAGWDNFTGSVIFAISEHILSTGSREELREFAPYLVAMRDWIQKMRDLPREMGYKGIFPVGKGSDWSDHAQFWTFTDSHNAMALRSMALMLERFEHPEASKTREIYENYRVVLENIRDEIYRGHEEDEAFILPHELGVAFEDSETYSYYTDGAPYLLYTGFIEPGSRMHKQMEEFFRRRGQFEKGLTGRMTSCSSMWDEAFFGGYGDVWYTMQSETYWVKAWIECGEYEKAFETMNAMMRYGMTREYVVSERYCSIEPWYSPWQPNGSGSARMIEMMLNYFGERDMGMSGGSFGI